MGGAAAATRGFIQPDTSLEAVDKLHDHLGVEIKSGHRADLRSVDDDGSGILTRVADAIDAAGVEYEDQCSARHYADVVTNIARIHTGREATPPPGLRTRVARKAARKVGRTLGREWGHHTPTAASPPVTRIVDVGVFMGGSSYVFAGCVEHLGVSLDLVDVSDTYLRFTYERLRRAFPAAVMDRVRMFHGDLPTYIRDVALVEDGQQSVIHHDGAHDFDQVVRDLAALYYVRDRVSAVAVQDTHLRCSDLRYACFVDAAVHAVFGPTPNHRPLGTVYEEGSWLTEPNQWLGNYFMPGIPEGMFIELADNQFRFPHPSMSLDALMRG